MRKSLLAAVSLVTASLTMFAAAVGPAAADPASAASASAHGLSATGLVAISPTITTAATLPPGQDTGVSPTLLTVPLGGLAFSGTAGVNASAHELDDITPALTGVPDTAGLSNPVTLAPVNARGVARTEGLGLVFTLPEGELDPVLVALAALPGLLTAQAVSAEAVARCVNNQPVFETGFQVAGLGGVVGGVLDPLVQTLLDTLLGLVSGDPANPAPLSAVISITPGVVTQTATGVAIDGLRISVPLLEQTIVVSHAEAAMPAGCGVAAAPPPTAAPDRGVLASTGTDTPLLPIGFGLIGAAAVGYAVVRRSRRTAAE